MSAPALDHVGVVTRDLAMLAEQYERLGFSLTPLARQADGRIGNRCAMLRQGYIELLAVVDPHARSATLEAFLARHAGIHILAFAIDDASAAIGRLRRAGVDEPVAHQFDRSIDDADPDGPRARFEVVALPAQPEGRINLVRHLTPEVLWQERFLQHPNRAMALAEVTIAVADPMATAARFSRLVGCAVVPDPADGLALELACGRVRLVAGALAPRVLGVTLYTSDGNAAVGRLLAERGIRHRAEADALLVDADAAGGVVLRFIGAAR